MHEDSAHANGLGGGDDSQHGVPEQVGSESLAPPSAIDRETANEDGRHRSGMLRRTLLVAASRSTEAAARL